MLLVGGAGTTTFEVSLALSLAPVLTDVRLFGRDLAVNLIELKIWKVN